jgi:hemin uptake protein HemP
VSASESASHVDLTSRMPVVRSEQLFGAAREIIIKHGDEEYRLRITRADKLILTK